jgi:low temperature requirement protein LtrA
MDNPAEQDKRASYLELFFDLVFVFAITQLSALLREDVRFAGLAKGAFLLLILWWAWSLFTWTTNWTGAERLGVRIGLMGAMAASLTMAIAVPEAFANGGS